MWTANINNVVKNQGKLSITVEYTNGTDSFVDTYYLTRTADGTIKNIVANKIKELTDLYTYADSLAIGAVDITPTPVVPTQAEVDKNTFLANYNKLKAMKVAITHGMISASNPAYLALVDTVKTTYKPEYIEFIS